MRENGSDSNSECNKDEDGYQVPLVVRAISEQNFKYKKIEVNGQTISCIIDTGAEKDVM